MVLWLVLEIIFSSYIETKKSPGAAFFFVFPLVLTGGGWVKQQKMRIMSMASTFFKCFFCSRTIFLDLEKG